MPLKHAQLVGPARDGDAACARHGFGVVDADAIEPQIGSNAAGDQFIKRLQWVRRELEAQEPLPCLFHRAAQIDDIRRLDACLAEQGGTESQQFIDHRHAVAGIHIQVIAEINQPVARLKASGQMVMQRRKAVYLAMDGGDGPNAARSAKISVFFVHDNSQQIGKKDIRKVIMRLT